MKTKRLLALLMAAALEISSFGVGGTVQAAGFSAETQTVLEQSAEEQSGTQAVSTQSVEEQSETQTGPMQNAEEQSETQTGPTQSVEEQPEAQIAPTQSAEEPSMNMTETASTGETEKNTDTEGMDGTTPTETAETASAGATEASETTEAVNASKTDMDAATDAEMIGAANEDKEITATSSGDFTYEIKDGGLTITGYTGSDSVVDIPSQINGMDVAAIGEKAFADQATITSVTIPATVITLGKGAFKNCTGLKSLTINTKIMGDADTYSAYFRDFASSESAVFYNAGSASGFTVTFGDEVTQIPKYLFATGVASSHCRVSKIILGKKVKKIDVCAFYYCTSLKEIEGGEALTTLEENAFAHTGFEKYPKLPALTTIGKYAYLGCEALESLEIDGAVTDIGEGAFQECTALKSVTIGGTVANIGDKAFMDDKLLKTVTISEPVTSIGASAFENDAAITTVVLPATLTSIGNCAFKNCTGLKDMTIDAKLLGDTHSWSVMDGGAEYQNYSVFYNAGSATGFTITFGDKATRIPNYLFGTGQRMGEQSHCRVSKVEINGNVTEVGKNAFMYCTSLEEIIFHGNAPKTFGENCFYGNTTTVQYPQTNKTWKADIQQDYGGTITWQAADIIDNGGSSGGSDTPTPVTPSGQSVIVVGQKLDLKTLLSGCDSYQMNVKGMATIKNGVLTAKKATGTTEFVVTGLKTENGKKVPGTAISITIEKPVASAKTLSATRKDQTINGVDNITGTTLKPTRWVSSKSAVVSVDEKTGVLTAQTKGVSVITAYYGEGTMAGKCTFKVKVSIPYFSKASGTKVTGAKFKLKLSGVPKDKTVTWASKDTKAAAVDAAGMVTVNEVSGSPVILTGTVDGVAYEYALSITEPQLKKTVYTLKVNKKVKIALKNTKIKITSLTADQVKVSNPSVAAFDTATGKVTALAAGSTNITLTVGGKDLTFSVTVQ